MLICGIQKLSLLDYPGNLAATIFTGGCNFRCPFCQNAPLVTGVSDCEEIPETEILEFLSKRVGKLDGVCITGGEPLLQPDLEDFIIKIRALGFKIKLDTNGTSPEKLRHLLDEKLLDYVAMDIKSSAEGYPAVTGIPGFDITPIKESIALLIGGNVEYEFRTTLVKGLHTEKDISGIGQLIKGAKKHFLQNFVDSGDLVGFTGQENVVSMSGFERPEIEHFKDILSDFVIEEQIRG